MNRLANFLTSVISTLTSILNLYIKNTEIKWSIWKKIIFSNYVFSTGFMVPCHNFEYIYFKTIKLYIYTSKWLRNFHNQTTVVIGHCKKYHLRGRRFFGIQTSWHWCALRNRCVCYLKWEKIINCNLLISTNVCQVIVLKIAAFLQWQFLK